MQKLFMILQGDHDSVRRHLERAIRRYCHAVRRRMLCRACVKKEFLRDFRDRIDRFQTEQAVSEIREIYAEFGTPREVADRFLATQPDIEVKRAKIKRWVVRLVLCAMLLFVAVYLTEEFIDMYQSLNGYYVIEIWDYGVIYSEETIPIL